MNEQLIEHTVEIDKYISATVRIPKLMDALTFKALMVKADKLFRVADVPIVTNVGVNVIKQVFTPKVNDNRPVGRPRKGLGPGKGPRITYTEEMDDFIRQAKKWSKHRKAAKAFNEKFNENITVEVFMKKYHYLKNRTKKGIVRQRKFGRRFTKAENKRIQELTKQGKVASDIYKIITKEFGNHFNKKGMDDKVYRARLILGMEINRK